MRIKISGNRDWVSNAIRDIAGIFPVELVEADQEVNCYFHVEQTDQHVTATAVFSFILTDKLDKYRETETGIKEVDSSNQEKRLVRKAFYLLLKKVTQKPGSPWGILTGIRPTKLVHRLLDQQKTSEEVGSYLAKQYLITSDKCNLLIETALNQRKFLLTKEEARKKVGIYIGIPFCPSRCLYCSFPAYSITETGAMKNKFLLALEKEIKAISDSLTEKELIVEHIYLGGGTPTSLTVTEMDRLLTAINRVFRSSETVEVTVEAGRPDTLSKEMLILLKNQQITRISVNPQTLQDKTLKIIGRNHTVADFWRAYFLAKELEIPVINVDLIIGLPGEKAEDVADTLEKLKKVQLDNLTVHWLALKRASKLMELGQDSVAEENQVEIAAMSKLMGEFSQSKGLIPYYLYRQKRIKGMGENIGYAKPGYESLYNIQIMEERQTIIGLGCGAGSKWVKPTDWTLTATYNPKDPLTYINKIDKLIERKRALI